MTAPTSTAAARPGDPITRYPGYGADDATVKTAQNYVWQDLRDLRNSEGEPYTDVQRLIYAQNQLEIRNRKFFKGMALWITVGAPLMWSAIWVVLWIVLQSLATS